MRAGLENYYLKSPHVCNGGPIIWGVETQQEMGKERNSQLQKIFRTAYLTLF
jgi:hypothetical protein